MVIQIFIFRVPEGSSFIVARDLSAAQAVSSAQGEKGSLSPEVYQCKSLQSNWATEEFNFVISNFLSSTVN